MKRVLFIFSIILVLPTSAYETYLRKGYSSCVGCHHSTVGGGMLTDYGKMISASISAFGSGEYVEGELKNKMRLGGKLDHALMGRVANLRYDNYNETFPMQADYLAAFKHDQFTVVSQLARKPKRKDAPTPEDNGELDQYYFRELKGIYQLSDENFLTVGRQRQNLGLGLEDHTLYNKSLNRFNVTDLSTVVQFDRITDSYNYYLAAFGPSYQEQEKNAETGLKAEARKLVGFTQVGAGLLWGQSDVIDRTTGLLFVKIPFEKVIFMLEGAHTQRETDQQVSFKQNTSLAQVSYFPWDFLELIALAENADREDPFETKMQRQAVGLNYKLTRNLSLRSDYKVTKMNDNTDHMVMTQLFVNWW